MRGEKSRRGKGEVRGGEEERRRYYEVLMDSDHKVP